MGDRTVIGSDEHRAPLAFHRIHQIPQTRINCACVRVGHSPSPSLNSSRALFYSLYTRVSHPISSVTSFTSFNGSRETSRVSNHVWIGEIDHNHILLATVDRCTHLSITSARNSVSATWPTRWLVFMPSRKARGRSFQVAGRTSQPGTIDAHVHIERARVYSHQCSLTFGLGTRIRVSPSNGTSRPPFKKKVTWGYFSVSAARTWTEGHRTLTGCFIPLKFTL